MNTVHCASLRAALPQCLLAAGLIFSAGCKKDEITEYHAPKDRETPPAAAAGETAQPGAPAPEDIKFKLPAGWTQLADPNAAARFTVTNAAGHSAVLMAMPFPEVSELTLVNIVRQRQKMAPLDDAGLAKIMQPVAVGEGKGNLIDLSAATSGTNNSETSTMLTVEHHGGSAWLFNFGGHADVVAEQKPALLEFLKSVSFVPGTAAPAHGGPMAAGSSMPTGHPSAMGGAGLPAAGGERPTWTVPTGWTETAPSAMLLAKFTISGAAEGADVTVSSLGSDGGGPLANVNRWRGQVGLGPVGEEEFSKSISSIEVPGGKAMLADINGTKSGKDARLIAVIWPDKGRTWFFKLLGEPAVAAREKDAFIKFVQSSHLPNG